MLQTHGCEKHFTPQIRGPQDYVASQQDRVTVKQSLHGPTRPIKSGSKPMNARVAKEEIALLMPTTLSNYADEPRFGANDTQTGIVSRAAAMVRWVAEFPRRQAVLAELSQLSDHELADIGLARAELGRVFDRSFAAQRSLRA
jgi:uncharacterized protein YjiS (DUF1127 family)